MYYFDLSELSSRGRATNNGQQPSEATAANKEKTKEKSKGKTKVAAAGAPYMKLDSFCSLNETFETPNIRILK
jgi:hypothetical protein